MGVGAIDAAGFRLRQFFMRDYGEEASLLWRLSEHLAQFDVLITYNGKAYDQPLLETRYRMARAPAHPFDRMQHLDLLFGARRLWKLRLESCRLVDLENQILGVERAGRFAGRDDPVLLLRISCARKQAFRLVPIFHHNALDILSLACLTAIVPFAFRLAGGRGAAPWRGPDRPGALAAARASARKRRCACSAARWRWVCPISLLFKTLWDIGAVEKRLGREDAALAAVTELAASRNPYRVRALEELAKHYEHRERNYAAALEMTQQGAGD